MKYVYLSRDYDGESSFILGVYSDPQKAMDFIDKENPQFKDKKWDKDEKKEEWTKLYLYGFYEVIRYEIDKEEV